MTLNIKKSNFVIFHPFQKKIDYNVVIKIMLDNNTNTFVPIQSKDCVKFLGVLIEVRIGNQYFCCEVRTNPIGSDSDRICTPLVLIDKNLTWENHINNIATKISRVIGVISRLRHFVPVPTFLNI